MLNGIKKSLEGAKGSRIDDLPGVLWSARTTVKEATGHSPFNLVYGSDAVLPIEVGIPSPRMTFYDYEHNEEEKPVNLVLLPQTRGNALLKSIHNKLRVARQFNQRVRARPILVGDWVVRKVEATGLTHLKGKLGSKWDGPYKVVAEVKPGTYRLESPEGTPLARPWYADNLKKYFI